MVQSKKLYDLYAMKSEHPVLLMHWQVLLFTDLVERMQFMNCLKCR